MTGVNRPGGSSAAAAAEGRPAAAGRRLRRAAFSGALLAWTALAGCADLPGPAEDPRPVVRGPLPGRVQHPLALTQLAFRPRRAAVLDAGERRFGALVAYSSIEEIRSRGGQRAAFDGELLRAVASVRQGLSDGTDVEVELPLMLTTSGFLDSFIESWHTFFFLPDGGRDLHDDDQYAMELSDGPALLYRLEEDQVGIGDVPVFFTTRLRAEDESGPALAWRFGIELPTGSEGRGFGNGAIDLGLGLLFERSRGRFTATGGIDYRVPGQSTLFREAAGHELSERLGLELGGEYRWSDGCSLLAQLVWVSPLVRSVALEEIDHAMADLGLGAAWDVGADSSLALSFHEDLVSATGPDFSVMVSWSLRP